MTLKFGSYGYNFEISELKNKNYMEWDSFVESSPQGTIFHKTSWLNCFDEYSYKIIVLTHKNKIVAGIPLPYVRRFGIKMAVNPPFTPYLGVLFRKSDQKYNTRLSFEKELSGNLARELKNFAPYIRYTFSTHFVDAGPFLSTGFSGAPFYSYILNLDDPLDKLLENMEKDTRNRINRSEKYNLYVSDASPGEINKLVSHSFERKNQKFSNHASEKLLTTFSINVPTKFLKIKNGDELVAGGGFVYDNKRAYYLFGGINSDRTYKGSNQLVVWNLIRYAKEVLGLREFDLLGSPNAGIARFVRGFGGKLTPGLFIYHPNKTYYGVLALKRVRRFLLKPWELK
jgi:hypothetical protein